MASKILLVKPKENKFMKQGWIKEIFENKPIELSKEDLEKNYQKCIDKIIKEFRKVRSKTAPSYFQEDIRLLAKIAIKVFIENLMKK